MFLTLLNTLCLLCLACCQALAAHHPLTEVDRPARVGLLVVATGRYIDFVPPLIESARKHFCKGHQVTYFVFTDRSRSLPPAEDIVCLPHQRLGWPYDTMMRYHAYVNNRDLLATQDYLYACDADMLFVDSVGDEIFGERVATLHPGFFNKPRQQYSCEYDTNPLSTACIHEWEGTHYFAGGFYGGSAAEVLKIVETNVANIDCDLEKGIIARWHDESHWNRYCIDHPPTVVLSPAYCYPESWKLPYPKKLLALDKNHAEFRADGIEEVSHADMP